MRPGWSTGDTDTVLDVLRRAAAGAPDQVFLDVRSHADPASPGLAGETSTTYAEMLQRARRRAGGLRALGVGPGHTVVSMLDNHLDAAVQWFAVNLAGAVHVPVNTAYKGEFLRHQIADSAAAVVVAEPDYARRVLAVADGVPELRQLVVRGPEPDGAEPDGAEPDGAEPDGAGPDAAGPDGAGSGAGSGGRPGSLRLSSLAELDAGPAAEPPGRTEPGDLTMLIYTAGTTGPSKGCMISHNYACNLARQSLECSTRRPGETLWTPLPLFHLNATATGLLPTALLADRISLSPRFSLSRFWVDVERSGARMVSLLGAPISLVARMPGTEAMRRCAGQVRIAYGAPFPPELVTAWRERFGAEVAGAPGYGLSEASMIVTAPLSTTPVPGASGRRNDDFDVRIVDGHDRELPDGEVGEILCRPLRPHVMFEGYWRRPDATAAQLRNLWFHTGDLGRFDGSGYFHFVDRKKDYLRRRGENISSVELESAFLAHPDVQEVVVHAVPSELTEDDVKVTAVLVAGSVLTEEQLCRWSVDRVPYFAVPRYVEFRTELPKNPVGRVQKYRLRDEGRTPATWDREESDLRLTRR